MIAVHGRAGLAEFDGHYRDPAVAAFRAKVAMALDPEVEAAYPARWIGKVEVETADGRRLEGRVDEAARTKCRATRATRSAARRSRTRRCAWLAYRDGASEAEMRRVIGVVWGMAENPRVPVFLG